MAVLRWSFTLVIFKTLLVHCKRYSLQTGIKTLLIVKKFLKYQLDSIIKIPVFSCSVLPRPCYKRQLMTDRYLSWRFHCDNIKFCLPLLMYVIWSLIAVYSSVESTHFIFCCRCPRVPELICVSQYNKV